MLPSNPVLKPERSLLQLVLSLSSLSQTTFPVTSSLATSPSMAFSPYLSHMGPSMGLMPELLPSTPMLVPGSPTGIAAMGNGTSAQKHVRTDKLEVCGLRAVVVFLCLAKARWKVNVDHCSRWPCQVCREFQRGNCTRGESDCRYAHPLEAGMVDCSENSVIVCMDYIKGRCSRDKCKYFHPPAHLQARIKAAQHQASQNTASAALVSPKLTLWQGQKLFVPFTKNKHWQGSLTSIAFLCRKLEQKNQKPILTFLKVTNQQ